MPNSPRTADRAMTIPMRIRKMTTGWGTMFPTFSTVSRNLCMLVFGAAAALDIALIPLEPEAIAQDSLRAPGTGSRTDKIPSLRDGP
ncbi:hypothetical protein D3C72_2268350 [compost metagenome]